MADWYTNQRHKLYLRLPNFPTLFELTIGNRLHSDTTCLPVNLYLSRPELSLHMESQAAVCIHWSRVHWSSLTRIYPINQLNSRMIVSDWILNQIEDRSQISKTFVIDVKDKSLEYSIRDVHNGLKGNTVKISLNVEYMPHVGIFSKVFHFF